MEPYSYGTGQQAGSNLMINQNGDYPTTKLNLPLLRYAEILLFKAEALMQQGKMEKRQHPQRGTRPRRIDAINNPTLANLKHERRVELACEWTDRLKDLKRWGDYDKIKAPLHGRKHSNNTDPNSPFTIVEIWRARNFDPAKHMAWPINPDEILRANGAYKQTPGWE